MTPRVESRFRRLVALAVAPLLVALTAAPVAMAATGDISTVAGSGIDGDFGDGGVATSAAIRDPLDVAVAANGDRYIVDYGSNKVRKVTAAGIISTFAGNGTAGLSGDGGAATSARLNQPADVGIDSAGNVYIADAGNARVRRVTPGG